MAKKLADMTPEQRAECVGMWVFDQELGLLIYSGVDRSNEHMFMQPAEPDYRWDERLLQATPRFDLPRAWNPDGTPPAGQWEKKEYRTIRTILTSQGEPEYEHTHTKQRRWVTDWEDTP